MKRKVYSVSSPQISFVFMGPSSHPTPPSQSRPSPLTFTPACLHVIEAPIVSFGRCTRENSIGSERRCIGAIPMWMVGLFTELKQRCWSQTTASERCLGDALLQVADYTGQ